MEVVELNMMADKKNEINTPSRLIDYIQSPNIAEMLEDKSLGKIGKKALDEYQIDEDSRAQWKEDTKKAMDLAKMVKQEKNYPWPKASNVKYPIITTAAIQFNARSYPAIVKGTEVVKGQVVGDDPANDKASRALRISEHMSYQLLHEMKEWEADEDRQLLVLPIVGTDFKKSYFDPSMGRNVSVRVSAENCVVNNKAKSLETAPRISEIFTLYPHEIVEKIRFGIYRDDNYYSENSRDEYEPIEFIEQHRVLDLDGDGYPEPYIVTIHRASAKVARIVARYEPQDVTLIDESKTIQISLEEWVSLGASETMQIAKINPIHYYTKYGFIPDPDGGFYDIGFGILLNPMNESINTTLNQLIDAGHLSNTGGGFIGRGLRMKRGEIRFKPGEYKTVDVPGDNIRNNIVPLQFPGPSAVLFQLLGMLIQATREVTSVSEIMSGDSQMAMAQPTTVMALIEQGQMVFGAIYKRIYRSLTEEFKKLYRLNSIYLEDQVYFRVMDEEKAVARNDYVMGDMDVIPVSDPSLATDQQKLARANFLMQFVQDPFFSPMEIRRRMLEAAKIEDIDKLLVPPQSPGPDIKMLVEMAKIENKRAEIDNSTRKTNADIIKAIADAVLSLEKAESENAGTQLEAYRMQLQTMIQGIGTVNENQQRRIQGMANDTGRQGLPPVSQRLPQS